MTDKPVLRARFRAARDAFVAGNPPRLEPSPEFRARLRSGLVVASFIPIGSEADPELFARAAGLAGCTLALPHVVSRTTPLRFLAWTEADALEAGPYGLRQPAAQCEEVAPDIILTPLVAFDRAGNRLGQGAGHYDRAFAAHPDAWRVGIGWSMQEAAALPADTWDVPLHAIATERGWIAP